jgi:putative ABC transport system permease protein
MTLGTFIIRNAFRNKRRSLLTMVSISFSLLLLTMMICIWRSFYVDQVAPEAARRLIIRDRVSLAFFLPAFYREKIRAVQGVTAVAPLTWFGGRYIDDRPEHFFAQLGTDPDEYLKVASDKIIPEDQLKAWQHDRAGAIVDVTLADKYGWKIGDRVTLQANIFSHESGSDDSWHLPPRSASECALFQHEVSRRGRSVVQRAGGLVRGADRFAEQCRHSIEDDR